MGDGEQALEHPHVLNRGDTWLLSLQANSPLEGRGLSPRLPRKDSQTCASVMVWSCIAKNGTGDCMQSTARSMRSSIKASWQTIFSLFCRDCDPTSMISFNSTQSPAIGN